MTRFATKLHVKKGDMVKVISGDNKGKTGRIVSVSPKTSRAIVEGLNMVSRHTKPNAQNPQGAIIKKEAPIHISNLMVMSGSTPSRIGRKVEGDKIVRVAKKTGEVLK
ncbi:MAG: 50S ribosomal protein L24 [Chitinophagales bacterium]|jgi:large subunit ribosomal protein L24|nr:50S ribosomal protein L24 [Chitinophagales bacterium]